MTAHGSSEQVWAGRVQAWRASGESAEGFARGKGYSGSALRMWGHRLSPTSSPRIVALVPRRAGESGAASTTAGELTIELGGVRIRVGPGFDHALLAEVIGVLGTGGAAR